MKEKDVGLKYTCCYLDPYPCGRCIYRKISRENASVRRVAKEDGTKGKRHPVRSNSVRIDVV